MVVKSAGIRLETTIAAVSPWSSYFNLPSLIWASLVAQLVKKLAAVQKTRVRSLGWEDPLEKG